MNGIPIVGYSDRLSGVGGDSIAFNVAEMIFYETGWGGSVFSVGSITWCGALSHDRYRNDVSTVMRNYLRDVSSDSSTSKR